MLMMPYIVGAVPSLPHTIPSEPFTLKKPCIVGVVPSVPSLPHTVPSGPFPLMMPCIGGAVPSLPHTVPSEPFPHVYDALYSWCGTVGTVGISAIVI